MAAAPKITCFPAVTLSLSPIWESRAIIFAITTTPYDNSVKVPQQMYYRVTAGMHVIFGAAASSEPCYITILFTMKESYACSNNVMENHMLNFYYKARPGNLLERFWASHSFCCVCQ